METDSGKQTRLFYFQDSESPGGNLQGVSRAHWDVKGRRGPVRGGSMSVVTTKLKAGYLRKNGVPYSDKTELTEYYTRTDNPNGDSWLVADIYVDGAISEVATRRSEFAAIMKKEGIDGLIAALNRKVDILTAAAAKSS